MTLVLDAGALLALERDDRRAWGRLRKAVDDDVVVATHGGIVGQAWRGRGARQALLARALAATSVYPLDDALGRAAGQLLARSRTRDVIDAALVALASDGDVVMTSDPSDICHLAEAAERDLDVLPV